MSQVVVVPMLYVCGSHWDLAESKDAYGRCNCNAGEGAHRLVYMLPVTVIAISSLIDILTQN